jgi:hypothetical protein
MAFAFFFLSFAVYNLNGRCIPTHDTLPARLLPVALLTRGTLTLDQFGPELMGHPGVTYFYTHDRDGHRVSMYPVVVPLLVTPFFLPAAAYSRHGADTGTLIALLDMTEKASASFIAALSVAVMWLVLSRWSTVRTATLLTVAYAFATETWMISSQALWQHGASELFLAGLLLALGSTTDRAGATAGALSALLIAARPTNAVFAAAAGIVLLRTSPRRIPRFVAGGAPILALWLAYNLDTFGSALGGYGAGGATSELVLGRIPAGSAGLLFSPGRGLVCFAPFVVFLAGLARTPVRRKLPAPMPWMLLAAMLQLLVFGSWHDWTGGECYGPRFLTDMMPVLIVALIPIVERLPRGPRRLFVAAVLYGIAVQAIGAFCYQMGGSGTPRDQWSPASIQYIIELRAGPAPPSFGVWRAAARAVRFTMEGEAPAEPRRASRPGARDGSPGGSPSNSDESRD